jgi:multidrug efflux pump subunit AcrA (membrane-fusion protein)
MTAPIATGSIGCACYSACGIRSAAATEPVGASEPNALIFKKDWPIAAVRVVLAGEGPWNVVLGWVTG